MTDSQIYWFWNKDPPSVYPIFNNKRSHGILNGLPQAIFWALDDLGYVEEITDHEKRTNKIMLNVAY